MSNFQCEKCGTICYDTPNGYITGCEHYPADLKYINTELVGRQVRDQVRGQVGDQVNGQVRDQVVDQVRDQVRDQVWNQVWDQVGRQVWGQVNDKMGQFIIEEN